MIDRLRQCWLILTGKGSVRLYDDDRPPLFDRLRSAISEGLSCYCVEDCPNRTEENSFMCDCDWKVIREFEAGCPELHPANSSDCQDPWCPCFDPDLNDLTIEEIADSIKGS